MEEVNPFYRKESLHSGLDNRQAARGVHLGREEDELWSADSFVILHFSRFKILYVTDIAYLLIQGNTANSAAEYGFGLHQFKKKWHPVLQSTRVRLHAAENDQKHLGPWQFLRSREAIRLLWNSRFFWPLRKFFLKRKTFVSKKFQVTKR